MTPVKSSKAEAVSLASLADGAHGRFVRAQATTAVRTRLVAMGLRPGTEVHVVHNGGRGPFVVAVEGARIVLGRGMAHRVLVTVPPAPADRAAKE